MDMFTFATAGRIIFGAGRVRELAGVCLDLGRRPFVVTPAIPGWQEELIAALGETSVFAVDKEPTVGLVRRATAQAREHRADFTIGIGGGSVMDVAKVVAALVVNGGDPLDYAEVIGRGLPLPRQALPCVAVPTTSGSGSEVTANGVLTSEAHSVKVSLRSPSMLPTVALVDPELTIGCPPVVTAFSGLDALVQCIEPFVSPFATPMTDGFCREGIARAGRGLRRAYADGTDLAARVDMSLCSLLGGLSLANGKLGIAHGIAAPLGGLLGAPHGAITASVMAASGRVNLAALREADPRHPAIDRYAEVGEILTGVREPEAGLDWFAETAEILGVRGLAALGMTEEGFGAIVEATAKSSSTKGNPVVLSPAQLQQALRDSM